MTDPLTDAERRVLDALDEQLLVDELVAAIRVPSITGTDAESELQHRYSAQLQQLGFDVDDWKLDLADLARHTDHPGTEAPRTEGYGLVGTTGPSGTPALVLQGHIDVVPTGDLGRWPGGDAFSGAVRDAAVHGRGACDMKAGVAANLAVARALVTSGVRLERAFAVHSVISEEDGGLGAFATMLRGHRGEAAVLTEPTSGRIVVANAGALTFRLRVSGRAAHGSSRLDGHSAFQAFLSVHREILELERERNAVPDALFHGNALPYPISIGTVRAGDWASSVPDLLIAEGRLGVQLGESPADARCAFAAAVSRAADDDPWLRDNPPVLSWSGGQFASGRIDEAAPLVAEVASAIGAVEGRIAALAAAPYGSDLRLYADIGGIPTLHYGPGNVSHSHAPREHVLIDELLAVTRSLALLAARRCGVHL